MNAGLPQRLGTKERSDPTASRIIAETIREGLIKSADPASKSKKQAKYVPFWL